jgi:hypothetical protein
MLRAIPKRIHTVLEIWKSAEDNKNNLPSVCEEKNYRRCIPSDSSKEKKYDDLQNAE